jgi:hypothetical protein
LKSLKIKKYLILEDILIDLNQSYIYKFDFILNSSKFIISNYLSFSYYDPNLGYETWDYNYNFYQFDLVESKLNKENKYLFFIL